MKVNNVSQETVAFNLPVLHLYQNKFDVHIMPYSKRKIFFNEQSDSIKYIPSYL